MDDRTINELLELVDSARKYLNGFTGHGADGGEEGDSSIAGQWNTFQYVANHQEMAKWANVHQLTQTISKLKARVEEMHEYIINTNEFLDIIENLALTFKNQGGIEE